MSVDFVPNFLKCSLYEVIAQWPVWHEEFSTQ